jgi:Trk-type K+ transport system membrane component
MITFYFLILRFLRLIWIAFKDHEFRSLLWTVIILLIAGTFFYHNIEKWKILDSLYFSVTTLTTVGLGDYSPKTDVGKVFTIFYIFIGIGVILGFVDLVAHHTKSQNPFRFLNRKKGKRRRG